MECALVGAVDLAGDLRRVRLAPQSGPNGGPGAPADAAVALVLKRLDRARRTGTAFTRSCAAGSAPAAMPRTALAAPCRKRGWMKRRSALRGAQGRGTIPRRGLVRPRGRLRCGRRAHGARNRRAPPAGCPAGGALRGRRGRHRRRHLAARRARTRGRRFTRSGRGAEPAPGGVVRVPAGGRVLRLPPAPAELTSGPPPLSEPSPRAGRGPGSTRPPPGLRAASEATARAHAAFLEVSAELTRTCARALEVQRQLLQRRGVALAEAGNGAPRSPPAYDRAQCLEFARGSAARVLGPEFAEVDTFAARVRLPDEPLMLVDRIIEIHGKKGGARAGAHRDRARRPARARGTWTAAGRRSASRSKRGRPTSSCRPGSGSTLPSAAAALTGCWTRRSSFTATCPPPGRPSATPSRSRSSCARATPTCSSSASTGPSPAAP